MGGPSWARCKAALAIAVEGRDRLHEFCELANLADETLQ